MNKIFSILLILSNVSITNAQQTINGNEINNEKALSIATSPLSLLELEPCIHVQVMYKYHQKYAVAIEIGRIIRPFEDNDEDSYSAKHIFTGWRFRPEFRFVSPGKSNGRTSYISIQGLLKDAREDSYHWVQRTTASGFFYREAIDRTIRKTVSGLNLVAGVERDFSKSDNFTFDVYTGGGVRHKHFKDNVGTNFNSPTGYGFNSNKNGLHPTILLGCRIRFKMN